MIRNRAQPQLHIQRRKKDSFIQDETRDKVIKKVLGRRRAIKTIGSQVTNAIMNLLEDPDIQREQISNGNVLKSLFQNSMIAKSKKIDENVFNGRFAKSLDSDISKSKNRALKPFAFKFDESNSRDLNVLIKSRIQKQTLKPLKFDKVNELFSLKEKNITGLNDTRKKWDGKNFSLELKSTPIWIMNMKLTDIALDKQSRRKSITKASLPQLDSALLDEGIIERSRIHLTKLKNREDIHRQKSLEKNIVNREYFEFNTMKEYIETTKRYDLINEINDKKIISHLSRIEPFISIKRHGIIRGLSFIVRNEEKSINSNHAMISVLLNAHSK